MPSDKAENRRGRRPVDRKASHINLTIPPDLYDALQQYPDLNRSQIAADAFRAAVAEKQSNGEILTVEKRLERIERMLKSLLPKKRK